ncbi:hypothetical protein OTU49_002871 [Cherax quadricarinatus]|uniref:Secreted protein n=1 Tax=Cherax quadricarinatus TaxID=27406 RepID=A0AAW0XK29_CHEQU
MVKVVPLNVVISACVLPTTCWYHHPSCTISNFLSPNIIAWLLARLSYKCLSVVFRIAARQPKDRLTCSAVFDFQHYHNLSLSLPAPLLYSAATLYFVHKVWGKKKPSG